MVGVALLLAAAGFAQFSPAAALADVAERFGEVRDTGTVAEQAGLPGTVLGAGLAVIRLSALVALPLAALADRRGRRRTVLAWIAAGLAITAAAAGAPGYWWFVAALALARPLLTATGTLGQVLVAELTSSRDRAAALALLSAAYGIGAGSVAVLRGMVGDQLGVRGVFLLAGALLALVVVAARLVVEPDRFARHRRTADAAAPVVPLLGALGRRHRGRVAVLAGITFAAGFITGPATTFVFVYTENVLDASASLTGALVVVAGATGLVGLLVGRFLADRVGRRPTGAAALVLLAGASLVTYSGSIGAVVVGYPLAVLVGAAFGTPTMALAAELFPTPVRATVAGWLVVSGVIGSTSGLLVAGAAADVAGGFTAALALVCVPSGLAAALFTLVPETRGRELDGA